MTRRLALRRFPNEVVRRRQGPGGFNGYGEFEPGRVVETIFPAGCCRCRWRTRTSPAG